MYWLTFTTDKLTQDVHIKAQRVGSVNKIHVTTIHSGSSSVIHTPFDHYGIQDDWKMSVYGLITYYGSSYKECIL
jgi:hypothetical protein